MKDVIYSLFENSMNLSFEQICLNIIVSAVLGFLIFVSYMISHAGTIYSKKFNASLVILATLTGTVMTVIGNNIALSLGMVGALSIVRFRTAVKEPVDTGFMFWAITAGIMAGANLYLAAIIGSLMLGILYYICYIMGLKMNSKYLVIVKYDESAEDDMKKILSKFKKYKIKSKSRSKANIELTFEVELNESTQKIIDKIGLIDGVQSSSLISYQNDFGD